MASSPSSSKASSAVFDHRRCHPTDHRYLLRMELLKDNDGGRVVNDGDDETGKPDERLLLSMLAERSKIFRIKYTFPYGRYRETTAIQHHSSRLRNFTSFPLSRIVALFPLVSLEVVRATYEAYPDAIYEPDQDGRLPIHYACRFGIRPSLELLVFLVDKYPESVCVKTNDGILPFHYACSNVGSMDIIKYLFSLNSHVVTTKTRIGWYPLHFACRWPCHPYAIRYVLKLFPRASQIQAQSTQSLPIHHACSAAPNNDNVTLTALRQLVDAYPDGVRQPTKGGHLPLHAVLIAVAFTTKTSKEEVATKSCAADFSTRPNMYPMVDFLLGCHPEGARHSTKAKKAPLPLQIVCSWPLLPGGGAIPYQVDVASRLLQQYPQALRRETSLGKSAIDLAVASVSATPDGEDANRNENGSSGSVFVELLKCVDENYDGFNAMSHAERGEQLNLWKQEAAEAIQRRKQASPSSGEQPDDVANRSQAMSEEDPGPRVPGDASAQTGRVRGDGAATAPQPGAFFEEEKRPEDQIFSSASDVMQSKRRQLQLGDKRQQASDSYVSSGSLSGLGGSIRSAPGAVSVPGINRIDADNSSSSEDNLVTESLPQEASVLRAASSTANRAVDVPLPESVGATPIAAEISPDVRRLEEELRNLREQLGQQQQQEVGPVVEARAVTHQDKAVCCIIS